MRAPQSAALAAVDMPTSFMALDGRYVFSALDGMIELIVDSLRRERYNLVGELEARCSLPGAQKYGDRDTVLITSLNWSNARARQDVAHLLANRARTGSTVDWAGYLEDFCQRIWATERSGQPSVLLHEIPRPTQDATIEAFGFTFLLKHPQITFAPGGTGKSFLGAAVLGELARRGIHTTILDWEMDGGDSRLRGDALRLPHTIRYRRCDQPLVVLADSIRRDVLDHGTQWLLIDSIAPACNGPAEEAKVAIEFFAAWRRIGVGGLAIAHTRAEDGEQRPFGSVFWHNLARSTWFLKRVGESAGSDVITLGCFQRKTNCGRLRPPFGVEIRITSQADHPDVLEDVSVHRINVADVDALASSLPLWQRIKHALAHEPKTITELAEELDAKPDTVKKALVRDKGRAFTLVPNASDGVHRWAKLERRTA